MAKMTLIAMVQDVLNDMDSEDVNSLADSTEEALQVASIIRTTYYEIINSRYWPHLRDIGTLDAYADSDYPVHFRVAENVQTLEWLKYNSRSVTDTKDKYLDLDYMEPKDFIDYLNLRDSSKSNVRSVTDISGTTLLILNDTAPTKWSSFDDEIIIMDAYDSAVDTTLQQSKLQAQTYREPTFSITDAFIPDLPGKAFPYLLSESKSVAFNALRQVGNQKEEQRSRRQRTWLAREKGTVYDSTKAQNWGRKR